MEVIAELEPTRSYEKLQAMMRAVEGLVDWVDFPEAPLGVPRAHSVVVATVVQRDFGLRAIAHVRVLDLDELALNSILGATRLAGIGRVVLLRGDPGSGGTCRSLGPEEALRILRMQNPQAEAGLLLSLRKGRELVRERLSAGADFYLVLNARGPGDLRWLSREASARGAKIIPYVIVETPANKRLLEESLPGKPRVPIGELRGYASQLEGVVDGILVSVPGDLRGLREALERLQDLRG